MSTFKMGKELVVGDTVLTGTGIVKVKKVKDKKTYIEVVGSRILTFFPNQTVEVIER